MRCQGSGTPPSIIPSLPIQREASVLLHPLCTIFPTPLCNKPSLVPGGSALCHPHNQHSSICWAEREGHAGVLLRKGWHLEKAMWVGIGIVKEFIEEAFPTRSPY